MNARTIALFGRGGGILAVGAFCVGTLLGACGPSAADPTGGDPDGGVAADAHVTGDASTTADGQVPGCPLGIICVDSFPFHDDNDTADSNRRGFDAYGCSPGTDESGPEIIYRVVLPEAGFLSAAVPDDVPGVDIDLHLLGSLDANDCIDRGHRHVGAHLPAGTYYLVADTWVSAQNGELAGPYSLDIGFIVPTVGDCAVTTEVVDRLWGDPVTLPATGAMVLEAHLVTEEDGFPSGVWPTTITEGIPDHYLTSYALSGLVMARSQPWCPQESSEFGQAAYSIPLPGDDEAWYVNMLWSSRPPAGTRMIVRLPGGGPAVVAAAGYETGPGDTTHLGGVTEEIHFYLGTGHLEEMTIGFAVDQNLPLGPIDCR